MELGPSIWLKLPTESCLLARSSRHVVRKSPENPTCAGDLSLLEGLDYINPSRREVAGRLLPSEFCTDLVQGFDRVH